MTDTFVPYRELPALDKGPEIGWEDLESGMLFEPLAGSPNLRRVRGFPVFIWDGEFHAPAFLVGSEDAADGRPCGGVIGTAQERYVRRVLPDGRPVYRSTSDIGVSHADTVERLTRVFRARVDELDRTEGRDARSRLWAARQTLRTLTDGPQR